MQEFSRRYPEIDPETFIAETASIVGRVILKKGASVWYGSVLRADLADIEIGEDSNIQDNCVIHVETDIPTVIGARVTVGHGALLHACTVEDECLVGMGSVLLDGCRIRRGSAVGAGALVPPGKDYPEGSLILGSPARAIRTLTEKEKARITDASSRYRSYWGAYLNKCIPVLDISLKPE